MYQDTEMVDTRRASLFRIILVTKQRRTENWIFLQSLMNEPRNEQQELMTSQKET